MSTESPDKQASFEKQIKAEFDSLSLSSDVLDTQSLEVGKVSEIVGKGASENIPSGQKPQKKRNKSISHKVAGLLAGGSGKGSQVATLRTPVKQKIKVRKALEKRTKRLVSEATKMQNSKNFSASRLEEIILEIRHLREILAGLVTATVEKLENLYRRFVVGSK